MEDNPEVLFQLVADLRRRHFVTSFELLLNEAHHFWSKFRGTLRPWFFPKQSGGAFPLESILEDVECLTADTETSTDIHDTLFVGFVAADHFVANLKSVVRIKEIGVATEQLIVHPLGASIKQPDAIEVSVLRGLGVLHTTKGKRRPIMMSI